MNIFDLRSTIPGDDLRDLRDCLRAAQMPLCRECGYHHLGPDGDSLCRARNRGVDGTAPQCVVAQVQP